MTISRKAFRNWLDDPITQEVIKDFNSEREGVNTGLMSFYSYAGNNNLSERMAFSIGVLAGLERVVKLRDLFDKKLLSFVYEEDLKEESNGETE